MKKLFWIVVFIVAVEVGYYMIKPIKNSIYSNGYEAGFEEGQVDVQKNIINQINANGFLTIVFDDGKMLILKPYEQNISGLEE